MVFNVKAKLTSIKFHDGSEVELNEGSILAIIGPNNSGKSTFLREVTQHVIGNQHQTKIIDELLVERIGSSDFIRDALAPYADAQGNVSMAGHSFHLSHIEVMWQPHNQLGPFLAKFIMSELSTRERLQDCDPVAAFDARDRQNANHPFQAMYADDQLELEVSTAFRRAFKKDFVIHRMASAVIPAYVGQRPVIEEGEDRQSRSYLNKVERLDRLEEQGDGMRSFASVVGRVITEKRNVRLIDEPEAFLHPPQAKIVASIVAAHSRNAQTIIATHSSDIIQGLLGDDKDRVSVVRLKRTLSGSKASLLTTEDVAKLWDEPILRFSRVLDGLFHDGVIITEADPDCRFYEGLANRVVPEGDQVDVHYAYAGGKDRVPTLVSALTAVDVPVASILDFDVLNNEKPLRPIVEAHGGKWSDYVADWTTVKEAVESKETFLSGDRYRSEVTALLKSYGTGVVAPKEVLSRIKGLSRKASPWENVKDTGIRIVPAGPPTIAAHRLLDQLKRIGIFIAPNGEMEGFCRSLNMHGIKWVEEVMLRNLAEDEELADARKFIVAVLSYLRKQADVV